jgi:hypothetical protein
VRRAQPGDNMNCSEMVQCAANNVREDDDVFCPICAMRTRLVRDFLDSREGKTVRMFECRECGELVWVN